MTTGAKEQVGRLLALVPMIRREGEMSVEAAATALGMDPEQLVTDLRVLIYCGWPGWMPGDLIEVDLEVLDEDGLIRIHNADYLSTPLRLSAAEASAITVALRTLRESAQGETLQSLDGALAKIEAVAEEGRVEVHVPEQQRGIGETRSTLTRACTDRRQVQLTYYVPARDENTERTVDPLEVVDREGASYLQAWCHLANGRRLFRIDRIVDARVLESSADEHPEVEPLSLTDRLFTPSPDAPLVTLRLKPEARWVAEYYPVESTKERARGRLEVTLRVADERWLNRLLLRLAPHVTVLSPQEYADAYAAAAQDALRLYQ
ncbi:MAG: WYL domain-containing protein [Nocardioides sp.]|nr:WYL domain-containing protein [Nocardioides sp.]